MCKIFSNGIYTKEKRILTINKIQQMENKIQGETRAFNREGNLINNTFLYLDETTGKYEFRDINKHLSDLGLLDEKTKELDKRVQILSNQINERLKKYE